MTDELSARELEVLKQIVKGKTNQEIANTLYLAQRTIDSYVSKIAGKLNTSRRINILRISLLKRHNICRRPEVKQVQAKQSWNNRVY